MRSLLQSTCTCWRRTGTRTRPTTRTAAAAARRAPPPSPAARAASAARATPAPAQRPASAPFKPAVLAARVTRSAERLSQACASGAAVERLPRFFVNCFCCWCGSQLSACVGVGVCRTARREAPAKRVAPHWRHRARRHCPNQPQALLRRDRQRISRSVCACSCFQLLAHGCAVP